MSAGWAPVVPGGDTGGDVVSALPAGDEVVGTPTPPGGGAVGAVAPATLAGGMMPGPAAGGAAAAGEGTAWPGDAGPGDTGLGWPEAPGAAWPAVAGAASPGAVEASWPGTPEMAWALSSSAPGATRVAGPAAVAAAGRATTGVVRGTWRTAGTAGETCGVCCTRAAAPALTRCSNSAERSGARPAHSRRRLSSRACEKNSSARIAIPTNAANAAIAPIWVTELESESASGKAVMNPGSV
jgi:hypothetical protein